MKLIQKKTLREQNNRLRQLRQMHGQVLNDLNSSITQNIFKIIDYCQKNGKLVNKIAIYESTKLEPPTNKAIKDLTHREFLITMPSNTSAHAIGFSPFSIKECDIIICPALAMDAFGNRLGKGAGWYDKQLVDVLQIKKNISESQGIIERKINVNRPLIFALVFDNELINDGEIENENHDVKMDGFITEKRWCIIK